MDDWEYKGARDRDLPVMERIRSAKRECSLFEVGCMLIWAAFVKLWLQAYHRLQIRGRVNLPDQPRFVMVANHTSHLDALALLSVIPMKWIGRVYVVAAGDTFFKSTVSALFASTFLNALPIWRKKVVAHTMMDMRDRLECDEGALILFPEGTRSRSGTMGRFKPGVAKLVAGTDIPVIPCRIRGAHEAWPPDRKLPAPRSLEVSVGPALVFEDSGDSRSELEEITRRLEEAVRLLGEDHSI